MSVDKTPPVTSSSSSRRDGNEKNKEDEKSLSLLKFQEEKRSLCRNVLDEEVVFVKESGLISRSSSGDDARSSTPTTSSMASWCLPDEEEKKEDLGRPDEAVRNSDITCHTTNTTTSRKAATTTRTPTVTNDTTATATTTSIKTPVPGIERAINHVGRESLLQPQPSSKSLLSRRGSATAKAIATTTPTTSPPPLLTPEAAQAQELLPSIRSRRGLKGKKGAKPQQQTNISPRAQEAAAPAPPQVKKPEAFPPVVAQSKIAEEPFTLVGMVGSNAILRKNNISKPTSAPSSSSSNSKPPDHFDNMKAAANRNNPQGKGDPQATETRKEAEEEKTSPSPSSVASPKPISVLVNSTEKSTPIKTYEDKTIQQTVESKSALPESEPPTSESDSSFPSTPSLPDLVSAGSGLTPPDDSNCNATQHQHGTGTPSPAKPQRLEITLGDCSPTSNPVAPAKASAKSSLTPLPNQMVSAAAATSTGEKTSAASLKQSATAATTNSASSPIKTGSGHAMKTGSGHTYPGSMELQRQERVHNLNSPSQIPGTGLARQGGLHNLKAPPPFPNETTNGNLKESPPAAADTNGFALARQGGMHHLDQAATSPASAQGVARLPASATGSDALEPPLISDSKLRSLYQKAGPPAVAVKGVHPHSGQGKPHAGMHLPGRGLRRPRMQGGNMSHSHHHNRAVAPMRNMGPASHHGFRNGPRAGWISPQTKKMAEDANRFQRNQKLREKERFLQNELVKIRLEKDRNRKEQELAQSKRQLPEGRPKTGDSDDEDDLDISELGDDSIVHSSSFRIMEKVLTHRRPSDISLDPSLDPSVGKGASGVRRRRASINEKALGAIPGFKPHVSEPGGSITPRGAPGGQLRGRGALGEKRRGLQKGRSQQVMQNTAALQQQSQRSGLSSLTMGSDAIQEAVVKANERPGLGRLKEISLDKQVSMHSSLGSVSQRDLDVSAHLAAQAARPNSPPNFSSQLQPHVEGGSVSTATQSRAALDANTAVTPPTREQMEEKRQRRASAGVVPPGVRRPSQQQRRSISVPNDAVSVASSRVSGGPIPRRTSRTSNTSAGLSRRPRPFPGAGSVAGGGSVQSRRLSNPKNPTIPVPKGMEEHFRQRLREELGKKAGAGWDDILNVQNDIVMELACELSKLDNEKHVQAQQQLPYQMQKNAKGGFGVADKEKLEATKDVMSSQPLGERLQPANLTPQPDQRPNLLGRTIHTQASASENASVDAALRMALEESRQQAKQFTTAAAAERTNVNNQYETASVDAALRIALEESRHKTNHFTTSTESEADAALLGSSFLSGNGTQGSSRKTPQQDDHMDQALLLAIEESKREKRPLPQQATDHDDERALEIAMEMSLVDARANDRIRNARQLYQELGDSLPEIPPETSAPEAPYSETYVVPAEDVEIAGSSNMEAAMKLSKETYDFEVSRRAGHSQVESVRNPTGTSSRQNRNRTSTVDSALDYSVSTGAQNDTRNMSLVMPSELLEDEESARRGPAGTPERTRDDRDEALSLAMALSKMNSDTAREGTNDLSHDESLAYALELSRRAPGAHGSIQTSNSRSGQQSEHRRTSSAAPEQQFSNAQYLYQEYQVPTYQVPYPPPYPPGYQQPYQPPHYAPYPYQPQPYFQQPHYPPPPPMYQPPPVYPAPSYHMPPYQPYQQPYPPPQMYQPTSYTPQYYQQQPPPYQQQPPPYQQHPYPPPTPPRSQPFRGNRSVATTASATSFAREYSANSFDTGVSSKAHHNTSSGVENDDDAALRLALALSAEDARISNNRRRDPSRAAAPVSSMAADDKSLALALELSRSDAFL